MVSKISIEEGIKFMMSDKKDWRKAPVWTVKKNKKSY